MFFCFFFVFFLNSYMRPIKMDSYQEITKALEDTNLLKFRGGVKWGLFIYFYIFVLFRDQLGLLRAIKFYMSIKVDMRKTVDNNTDSGNFRTSATIILESTDIDTTIEEHFDTLFKKIDEFVRNGM